MGIRKREKIKDFFKNFLQNNFKNKSKQILASFLFLFWTVAIPLSGPATALFDSKYFINDILLGGGSAIYQGVQKKLNDTIDDIFIVAKSYPSQSDTIGVTGGNIIKFRDQMAGFIKNQIGITDNFIIADIVKNNEQLYRFLVDKRNNLNLDQKRSLENLSDSDLYYLKKLDNILVNYFKIQVSDGIAPELTEETPELRTISATLYCFTSDQDIKDLITFFDNILLKVKVNKRTELFTKCMKDVLDSQTTSSRNQTARDNQDTSATQNEYQVMRVAIIGDEDFNVGNLMAQLESIAGSKNMAVETRSDGGIQIYTINQTNLEAQSDETYITEISAFSWAKLIGDVPTNSIQKKLFSKGYYPIVLFAFNSEKYMAQKTDEKNSQLNQILSQLKDLAPHSHIVFVPIRNDSDIDGFSFKGIDSVMMSNSNNNSSSIKDGSFSLLKPIKTTDDTVWKILKMIMNYQKDAMLGAKK